MDHARDIVDQRQGERGDDHAGGDGQHHADVADGVAVAAVAGHQRAERVERLADRGVDHRVHQVIGDKGIEDLAHVAEIRHGEQQDSCDRIGKREPQDPDTRLAVFGMRAVNDRAHRHIGETVENTGDQHDHTDRARRDADYVRVEVDQQRGRHGVHERQRRVAEAVGEFLGDRNLDELVHVLVLLLKVQKFC